MNYHVFGEYKNAYFPTSNNNQQQHLHYFFDELVVIPIFNYYLKTSQVWILIARTNNLKVNSNPTHFQQKHL